MDQQVRWQAVARLHFNERHEEKWAGPKRGK
jgi:hypothetical protein